MSVRRHLHDPFESELVLVGAPSDAALPERVANLMTFLDHAPDAALPDIAFTCGLSSRRMPAILALVAVSTAELRDKLRVAQRKLNAGAARIRDKSGVYYTRDRMRLTGRMAFVFPGETSPYPDMLRDLCLVFDECRGAFDEADEAYRADNDASHFSDWIFASGAGHRPSVAGGPLAVMAGSLLASHTADTLLARVFNRLGIRPDGVTGHSGGEVAALEYAGVFGTLSRDRRVKFLRAGHDLIVHLATRSAIPSGIMLAVEGLGRDVIDALLARYPGRLALAMDNGAQCFVLCAASAEVSDEVTRAIERRQGRMAIHPFQSTFHTPWFANGLPLLRPFFGVWARHPPALPVYSCATAGLLPERLPELIKACITQWTSPVRLPDTIEQMYADGYRIFIELGARGQLSTRIECLLEGRPHLALATNRIHRSGMLQLNHVLAQLAAQGVGMDASALHSQRTSRLLDIAHPTALAPRQDTTVRLPSRLPEMRVFAPPVMIAARNTAGPAAASGLDTAAPEESTRRNIFGADFPLLASAEIVTERPGQFLSLSKTYALDDYPFIKDFALGAARLPTTHTHLHGFTVLSMATCLEIMAEAARRVAPRKRVDQVLNLRAQGWIGFEHGEVRLAIQAERIDWPDRRLTAVKVQLREGDVRRQFTWPLAETTVLLTSSPAETLAAKPTPLRAARPVNWTGQEIYPDRLPQGPLLRSVQHVSQWGEDGLDYELRVPPRADAVRYTRIPLFTCWPLLMDGVGSGMALWRSLEKFSGSISIPFRVRHIRFLASAFPDDMRLRAYLRIRALTPKSHVANIQVTDGQGRLLIDVAGWEELDTEVSPRFHRFTLRPAENFATRELPEALLGQSPTAVVGAIASGFPAGLFEANHELWLKTLAFTVLSPSERDDWIGMKGAAARRIEWLLGRVAAKDAVRRYLLQHHRMPCAAADIPVWADDSGKPHPHGAWRDQVPCSLDLSIAHTPGLIVAAVAANARIGIDLERIGRDLSEDFTQGVFTADEHELAARSGEGPTTILRFWCAKEALSKALGTGIRYSPSDLRVRQVDCVSGLIEMEVTGQWLDGFRQMRNHPVTVQTTLFENHVFAACVLPLTVSGGSL
jgi:malonyl CoA-acyl carrier protein transacylase/phosphopantetheinyl transferase